MKITIIGGGNMGGAIAKGLIANGSIAASDITISDPSEAIRQTFEKEGSGVQLSSQNTQAVTGADIVIVAVKPWLLEIVAREIVSKLDPSKQLLVSIVAGKNFETLRQLFGSKLPLFRVIPNTAITFSESMTFVAADSAGADQVALIKSLFDGLGMTMVIEERLMTAATALGSCGTAFALQYIQAAMKAGVEMGFYPDQAKEVVIQTLQGALTLLKNNQSHPASEIDKVTTPGGITIKGLNEMDHNGFTSAIIKGFKACQ